MIGWTKRATIVAVALIGAGCSGMPVAGPLASDVVGNSGRSDPAHVDYVVVDVTPAVCDLLSRPPLRSFHSIFGGANEPPTHTVRVGDSLAVTIWETGSSGLFSNIASLTATAVPRGAALPAVVVEQDGRITIPFAGRIVVAGKTPSEVEHLIVASLAGKASDPQVLVTVVASQEYTVAVGGEVARGARVPLGVNGSRILDAIAETGGVRIPVNESVVRLTRAGRTAGIAYTALLQHPEENIYLQPSDVLTVVRSPNTFTSFGALGRSYQIAFEADTISAEEAIAKAGGLQDQRADPSGVFVFRYEPASVADQFAPDRPKDNSVLVPVVYHLDMSKAGSYFLARRFAIQDKDIVYSANAEFNEVQKFLNLLGSVLSPAATGASVSAVIQQ